MVGMLIQEPPLGTQSGPSRRSYPSQKPYCSTRLQNHLKSMVFLKTFYPTPHPQTSQALDFGLALDLNFIREST